MRHHKETHYTGRSGWLRPAVLGANDGIISTASLILGVAAANAGVNAAQTDVLIAGIAGLVAGTLSMAAGEYVSVSSQADTETSDLRREKRELENNPEYETQELAQIYESRGLSPELAGQVAVQLMRFDALGAHARDELGLSDTLTARPLQAALSSAAAFAAGALLPLVALLLAPADQIRLSVGLCSLAALSLLGTLAARAGGANRWRSAVRVTFWGALAMAATLTIGTLLGTSL